MSTRVRSFSKVNLGLAIGPVRPDSFHGLTTVYQTLGLHDVVEVSAARLAVGTDSRIALTSDSNDKRVPTDGRNTAWRMVEGALRRMGVAAEVTIHIRKRLPVQGGMGAGSANAAAALIALDREMEAWSDRPSPLGHAERLALAAEVGSDVPLFLVGGTVLGEGRGERVRELPDALVGGRGVACVVAVPELGVSTPAAFRQWDAEQASRGLTPVEIQANLDRLSLAYADAFSKAPSAKPDASGITSVRPPEMGSPENLQSGFDRDQSDARGDLAENTLLELVHTGIRNDFEQVVFSQYPPLCEIKHVLTGADSGTPAIYAGLSGSGSALFGLYRSVGDAREAQQRVQESGTELMVRVLLTETLPRAEYWGSMFADVV